MDRGLPLSVIIFALHVAQPVSENNFVHDCTTFPAIGYSNVYYSLPADLRCDGDLQLYVATSIN